MKLDSIELISDGYAGVKFSGTEIMSKGGSAIAVPCTKQYPLPLPDELLKAIGKLRRYLLEVDNFWMKAYNEHIYKGEIIDRAIADEQADGGYLKAKQLWESVTMQKIYKRHNGYILSGKMKSDVTDRYFTINTPLIDPDDGYENFGKLQTGIDFCFNEVLKFVNDKKLVLMDPVQYAGYVFGEDSDEVARIKAMKKEEQVSFMVQTLESRGYIVMGQDDVEVTEKVLVEEGGNGEDRKD